MIDACKPFQRRDTFPRVVRASEELEREVRAKFGKLLPTRAAMPAKGEVVAGRHGYAGILLASVRLEPSSRGDGGTLGCTLAAVQEPGGASQRRSEKSEL